MRHKTLWYIGLFAICMAYFESAVVFYIRRLYGISDLTFSNPYVDPQVGAIEVGREAASLVMLLTVGLVAGKKFQSRLGYILFTVGLWDIFYYAWLKVFIGWPKSLVDTDLLFLIPLPWWGPVCAPVLISILMIVLGACSVVKEEKGISNHAVLIDWIFLSAGALLMLVAFMADALKALPATIKTLGFLVPGPFHWPVFIIGLGLAAIFVWRMCRSK
jgi:hypothetical protein